MLKTNDKLKNGKAFRFSSLVFYTIKKIFWQTLLCILIFSIFYFLNGKNLKFLNDTKSTIKNSINYVVTFNDVKQNFYKIKTLIFPEKLESCQTTEDSYITSDEF